jgi:putative ribosome biogenesis GTPase RsgA
MNCAGLRVSFFLNGRKHAFRKMHSRPMVSDIVILRDGDYKINQVVWPYKDDNELDWTVCNCVISLVNE